jgi:cell division protein ZapA
MPEAEPSTRVVVRIFGEECALRGDGTPERLRALAALVDGRMRAIAARTPQLGKTRVAMLAALQLAEELSRLQGAGPARPQAPAEPEPRAVAAPASTPPPRRARRPRA